MAKYSSPNASSLFAALPDQLKEWLPWVTKIRFVIISFVFAIDFAIRALVANPNPASFKYFSIAIILWYILGLYYLIYNQLSQDYLLQAYLQIFSDIAVITAILHLTGDLESNYLSLYLLVIILSSTLLPRGRVFLVAAVSFVCMGAVLELAYLPVILPDFAVHYPALRYLITTSPLPVDLRTLQVKLGASFFGFFAIAYLSSQLAENLRKVGAELRDKNGQVANLQAKTENILESMRDGLLTTNLEGVVSELNSSGAAILGLKPQELRGRKIQSFFAGFEAGSVSFPSANGFSTRQEVTYRSPRAEPRVLGVSVSPLMVPAIGVAGFVYNFQDLTEEKRREAEYWTKDRMATLGRMAAGIAHEIRNPLASITGSVKLLQSISSLDEDQTKLIEIVSHESERLNKLVSDFLLYCRDQRHEPQKVDLVKVIDETLVLLSNHPLFGGNVRVEKRYSPRLPPVWADPDKLRQVFWNITDNALKAMPEGGVLTVQAEEAGEKVVRVILGDTGVGFSEQQLEKVFEPFQPGFSGGTGLGLAIVYQIMQGIGGAIQVESKAGKGTRFILELPKHAAPAASPKKAFTPAAANR
ncbi:putative Signal transduction histidine kinase, nitrogen specific, NtrB [Acidobacteriia bacterium SbA2]|nr:putative Signal transduction histidine kinase, nitrogen specific, NtrB [Acidobacteriia bacterium SbA2]